MQPRRAHRTDKNQAACIAILRAHGFSVHSTSCVGNGFPDLAVGFRGETCLIELKDGGKDLTADEEKWHRLWKGQAGIAHSPEEALEIARMVCAEGGEI